MMMVYSQSSGLKIICWYAFERSNFENFQPSANVDSKSSGLGIGCWSTCSTGSIVILNSPRSHADPSDLVTVITVISFFKYILPFIVGNPRPVLVEPNKTWELLLACE